MCMRRLFAWKHVLKEIVVTPFQVKNNFWRASTEYQQGGCSIHICHLSLDVIGRTTQSILSFSSSYFVFICFSPVRSPSLSSSLNFLSSTWLRSRTQRGRPAPRSVRWLLFPCGDGRAKSISFAIILASAAVPNRRTELRVPRRRRNLRPCRCPPYCAWNRTRGERTAEGCVLVARNV